MGREVFAAFTMADMQKLDAAEFARGKDKQKRKSRGMGLAAKVGLGLAGAAGLGAAGRLAMIAARKGVKAGTGGFGSKRVTAAKSAMKQPYGPADTRTGPFDTRTGPFDTRVQPATVPMTPISPQPRPNLTPNSTKKRPNGTKPRKR